MNKPNKLLEVDVRDTLDWDPALDDRRISVNADNGHVTLTGSAGIGCDLTNAAGEEVISVAEALVPSDGLYTSHIRNEHDGLLGALGEAVSVGRRLGGDEPVQRGGAAHRRRP